MACSIFTVFQNCIHGRTTKCSPEETALSPLFLERSHAPPGDSDSGIRAEESEQGCRTGKAEPVKGWGRTFLISIDALREKEVGGFHLPARRWSRLPLKRDGEGFHLRFCAFVCARQRETSSTGLTVLLSIPISNQSCMQRGFHYCDVFSCNDFLLKLNR